MANFLLTPDVMKYKFRVEDSRPVVLFDRDNTLIHDEGNSNNVEKFEWLRGVEKIFSSSKINDIQIWVITNQSKTLEKDDGLIKLRSFNRFLCLRAEADFGVHISGVISCIHPQSAGCKCRKPGLLMLETVKKMCSRQFLGFVGDKESDFLAAKDFGIPGLDIIKLLYGSAFEDWLTGCL